MKKVKMALLAIGLCLGAGVVLAGYVPKNGFVPDEKTAIKIAEAVLFPIYGE